MSKGTTAVEWLAEPEHYDYAEETSMSWHGDFNRSGVSHFINSPAGRIFRIAAGAGFLVVGYLFRDHTLGVLSMVWSVFPLSAGLFDLCWVSAVLGGPLSGTTIRGRNPTAPTPGVSGPGR